MAHLGLTPQSVHRFGGFKVQGRGEEARARAARGGARDRGGRRLFAGARMRAVATSRPRSATRSTIPTIGIGAGAGVRRPGARLPRPARARGADRAAFRAPLRASWGTRGARSDRRLRRRRAAGRFPAASGELRGSHAPAAKPAVELAALRLNAMDICVPRRSARPRRLVARGWQSSERAAPSCALRADHGGAPRGASVAGAARPRASADRVRRLGLRQPDAVRPARGLRALSPPARGRRRAARERPAATLLFLPAVETIYPPGHATFVEPGGAAPTASRARCAPDTSAASRRW